MSNADEFYLNLCLQNAWQNQLLTLKNPAVGALVLDKYGAILSIESHQECGKPHAEVLAASKSLCKAKWGFHNPFLKRFQPNSSLRFAHMQRDSFVILQSMSL